MFLTRIILSNFKNYEALDLEFSPKINCFVGNNGVGKTNILDGIHYLSFCKSYFNSVDLQNIRHDQDFFAIHGYFDRDESNNDAISCIQKLNQKKQFKKNKKDYERLADHIGMYPLVMISPYDRDLINEGSEIRRKYLDSIISQFDKVYLDNVINYNKALYQRNALLKTFAEKNYFDAEVIEIWDQKLSDLGKLIFKTRKKFIDDFKPLFQQYFEVISVAKEEVQIKYKSQLYERDLDELLAVSIYKDRQLRYTSQGIHKDDIEFFIDGYPVKKFGSQGQQKSYVIAIKLAQFEYTRKIKGYKPILLLDDVFDKLDNDRVKQLIKLVNENSFGQVFITDTNRQRVERIFFENDIDHRIFLIDNGKSTVIENGK